MDLLNNYVECIKKHKSTRLKDMEKQLKKLKKTLKEEITNKIRVDLVTRNVGV